MGRSEKPIQRRSNGVYCVQPHLGGRSVMRSLEPRDIGVAHPRAGRESPSLRPRTIPSLLALHVERFQGFRQSFRFSERSRPMKLCRAGHLQARSRRRDHDFSDENTQARAHVVEQMQESGLTGRTINSKASLLSGFVHESLQWNGRQFWGGKPLLFQMFYVGISSLF